MAQYQTQSCCNPFGLTNHNWSTRKKNLRSVTSWMCERVPISIGSKICDSCRKKLAKTSGSGGAVAGGVAAGGSASGGVVVIGQGAIAGEAGGMQGATASGSGGVVAGGSASGGAVAGQSEEVFAGGSGGMLGTVAGAGTGSMLLGGSGGMQAQGAVASGSGLGMQRWGMQRWGMAAGGSGGEQGVIAHGSGKKDFVSVRQGEKRVHIQKRLVLSNLKEAYCDFKDKFPDVKVGFSKFAELRPRHCVLAGGSGTHSVCVCTIHQNIKLMIQGVKLSDLSATALMNYHDCLAQIMCNPPSPSCYLDSCDACPGMDNLRDTLVTLLDGKMIDNVVFKQWVSVDRSTLETYSTSADEFVDMFCEKLELLRPHCFIASQQAEFYKECKSNLSQGEILVTADFSENYSFILQDAAQGYHWNNLQATIHPFVGYYRDSGEIQHLSYVVISECLIHNTVAVYLFQKSFTAFLKRVAPAENPFTKIMYFSDGASSQYKNRKNFLNLCHHEEDFGITAEWHFSATSHGKGACDGLGGTVKRLAAKTSLQRPYDQQIMTPRQLFDWATTAIPTVHFEYCTTEDYEREQQHLEDRFKASRTIQGTRKLHSFVPISKEKLKVKSYSASSSSKEVRITSSDSEMPEDKISGFVTCVVEQKWWLGCVLQRDTEDPLVTVTLLHPHGPCSSFKYPAAPDVVTRDILTSVDPRTRTGRIYYPH